VDVLLDTNARVKEEEGRLSDIISGFIDGDGEEPIFEEQLEDVPTDEEKDSADADSDDDSDDDEE
ncbi:RNA polymerase sigma factor RpoD, partial [Marinomonas arenicola]